MATDITAPAPTTTPAASGSILDTARQTLNGGGPLIDQAKAFAKARPFASAALAGVLGVALINTLRGK
ncbi:hypothetical protein FHS31_000718 [Sphingomonas vulcanisoli]|uniref:DUF3618 domain-containing protein n=1 Tax=Sphingomonas vulcanisoli TaxID=1658060 RepID=A0ABX0TU71_9SPHN|nr:hypothetical protein [Sphingomonas vulcanisoli]NIJ07136.1 hypothetical protein [Sphingomonas vulcanisoli]